MLFNSTKLNEKHCNCLLWERLVSLRQGSRCFPQTRLPSSQAHPLSHVPLQELSVPVSGHPVWTGYYGWGILLGLDPLRTTIKSN